MLYSLSAQVVPTGKMKAKYAGWKHTNERLKASSTTKSIRLFLSEIKDKMEADEDLTYAIRKGGLQITARALGKDSKKRKSRRSRN